MGDKEVLIQAFQAAREKVRKLIKAPASLEVVTSLEVFTEDLISIRDEFRPMLAQDLLDLSLLNKSAEKAAEDRRVAAKPFNEILDLIREVRSTARVMRVQFPAPAVEQSTSERNSTQTAAFNASFSATLPTLKYQLPKFDGDIREFANFKTLFEQAMERDIEDSIRMHFLKQSMVGDAKLILNDFPNTNVAYSEAWERLNERYDNKRAVMNALFRDLFAIEPVKDKTGLRAVSDAVDRFVRGIRVQGFHIGNDPDLSSPLLAYYLSTKIDDRTRDDWENSLSDERQTSSYEDLRKFINKRCATYEGRNFTANSEEKTAVNRERDPKKVSNPSTMKKASFLATNSCVVCSKTHSLYNCEDFLGKTPHQRVEIINANRLCSNCMGPGHMARECTSKYNCRKCQKKHHTLLHYERDGTPVQQGSWRSLQPQQPRQSSAQSTQRSEASTSANSDTSRACMATGRYSNKSVLLPTAVVNVFDGVKYVGKARTLLDSGSQVHLIARQFAQRANIRTQPHPYGSVTITSISGDMCVDRVASFSVRSRVKDFELAMCAEVVENIPYRVPDISQLPAAVKEYELADDELPRGGVDILIGSEFYDKCLHDRREFIGDVVLCSTEFGWVIRGSQNGPPLPTLHCGITAVDMDNTRLEKCLSDYFKNESHEDTRPVGTMDCVHHFDETHTRDSDGRFVVRLPFKSDPSHLGESRKRAEKSLLIGERVNNVRDEYCKFISEYVALGHMSEVTNTSESGGYFIPHQMVTKLSSTTTKYRVVFNASAKTTSGLSLNDVLMIGPSIQPELFDTLIRFRQYRIAISGDIEKMYRQILVHPDDRQYQRILWRDDPSKPAVIYELNTVTYGTGPASFLSTKCLDVLAGECTDPAVSRSIRQDFYMDDWLSGADNDENAKRLLDGVTEVLSSGKFNLRKIISNSPKLLRSVPPDRVEPMKESDTESGYHILGVLWNPSTDRLRISVSDNLTPAKVTKRTILSTIARIFDPLGILSPVTVTATLLMQRCWLQYTAWDEPVCDALRTDFLEFVESLPILRSYTLDRQYDHMNDVSARYLIGYSDASQYAYSAVIFLCTVNVDTLQSSIVCAKKKVAPLKKLTIPRLELCAAVLLAELLVRVRKILDVSETCVFAFSDARVVLDWLNGDQNRWDIYVKNRIRKVRELVPTERWSYVPTDENPADLATRGISAKRFVDNTLWTNGPPLLNNFDKFSEFVNREIEPRSENVTCSVTVKPDFMVPCRVLSRFSDYDRLLRVMCYVCRPFLRKKYKHDFASISVSLGELTNIYRLVIRIAQAEHFQREIEQLQGRRPITNGVLQSLVPFLDTHGILRVTGRLENADVPYGRKHPIIMHASSHLVRLLVRDLHRKLLHANKLVLLNQLATQYWIVGGITKILKSTLRSCTTCARYRHDVLEQQMGALPKDRVTVERPFARVGVDFAGPFACKCVQHRVTRFYKIYCSVFVCFVTKAIHLETVSALSTEAFLDTLRRFVARRGKPAKIFSDNGTNFVGANNVLLRNNESLNNYANSNRIEWTFITPKTPHQGGLWESAVKSTKFHLLRATNGQVLNYEEYLTYFTVIESILNSRPICYREHNGGNVELLTPAHFLVGSSLLNPASLEGSEQHAKMTYSRRYILLQELIRSFWSEWQTSYLSQLQHRNKWRRPTTPIEVDSIVLLRENLQPPSEWRYGRIVATYPDASGLVRNVDVLVSGTIKRRNIVNLVRLDTEAPNGPQPGE